MTPPGVQICQKAYNIVFHLLGLIYTRTGEVPIAVSNLEWQASSYAYANIPTAAVSNLASKGFLTISKSMKDLVKLISCIKFNTPWVMGFTIHWDNSHTIGYQCRNARFSSYFRTDIYKPFHS